MTDDPPSVERFDRVDLDGRPTATTWDRLRRGWHVAAFLVGAALVGVGFSVEHVRGRAIPPFDNLEPVDWLLGLSLLAAATLLVAPLIRNPAKARRYWRRIQARRFGVASLLAVSTFLAVGLFAPVFFTEPTRIVFGRGYQPPVWTAVEADLVIGSCVGEVTNGRCPGTWQYPLGTTRAGRDLLPFVMLGARTAVNIAVVTAALLVPVGVSVGLVAAYAGGRVDAVLMRLAELLQTVPAVVIYLLFWHWNAEYRLLVLIAVFGLANWGGLARQVRNETRKLLDRPYVKAAQMSGASRWRVARRHLLPNVSRSVLATVTLQIPLLVLTEAALSFVSLPSGSGSVTLGDPTVVSWGQVIYLGVHTEGVFPAWWITVIPTVALVLTAVSLTVFGRVLGDVLDPESGH